MVFLRIDPGIPVVWGGPDEARVGLDPIRAILRGVDGALARGLGELVRGTSEARLASVMGDDNRSHELLQTLGELLAMAPPPESPRVAIVGAGVVADAIARVISGAAQTVSTARFSSDLDGLDVDVVVLVSDFVVSPIDIQPWLGRDIAHVPVVFGEASVTVGPLVRPGLSACVRCVELEHCDADPSWSAIAPQVWGRRSAAATPALATHAGAELLRLWDGDGGYSVRIDARSRERLTIPHALHPRCGCASLPDP